MERDEPAWNATRPLGVGATGKGEPLGLATLRPAPCRSGCSHYMWGRRRHGPASMAPPRHILQRVMPPCRRCFRLEPTKHGSEGLPIYFSSEASHLRRWSPGAWAPLIHPHSPPTSSSLLSHPPSSSPAFPGSLPSPLSIKTLPSTYRRSRLNRARTPPGPVIILAINLLDLGAPLQVRPSHLLQEPVTRRGSEGGELGGEGTKTFEKLGHRRRARGGGLRHRVPGSGDGLRAGHTHRREGGGRRGGSGPANTGVDVR